MSDISITPEMGNGLRECTVEDLECMNVLMASAIPLSVMWKEKNNDSKIISWDSELEDYLAHRAKLIDNEGREKMMPYNLYKSLGLNWVMGYNYIQKIGDCLPGNTLVMTLNGAVRIAELCGKTVPMLSQDRETDKPVIRNGRAYKSTIKRIVEIHISSSERSEGGIRIRKRANKHGEIKEYQSKRNSRKQANMIFRISEDHKIMLKSGKMIRAGDLKSGMRVMSHKSYIGKDGYAAIAYNSCAKNLYRLHNLLANKGQIVHHENEDKLDNSLENLVAMSRKEHVMLHGSRDNTFLSNKKIHAKTISARNNNIKQQLLKLFWELSTCAQSDNESNIYQAYYKSHAVSHQYPNGRVDSASTTGKNAVKRLQRQISKHFGTFEEWSNTASFYNGTVVCVKDAGLEQCYDIEIYCNEDDDSRDYTNHNFMVCSEGSGRYNGYLLTVKNCCSMGHKNSLKASDLVNMYFTKRQAVEIHPSITYSYARGNGRFSWGSGLNLNPMQKYAADMGNFSISDIGKYTGGRPSQPNGTAKQNAQKHQSIIIPLPDTKFDTIWKIASAGIGVNIGSSVYPSAAKRDKNGVAVVSSWSRGGHSTGIVGAFEKSSTRYLLFENSHGDRYATDELEHPSGCSLTESDWKQITSAGFNYGVYYGNVGELIQ